MKICPKCNEKHSKNGKFCSRSCANSRKWSERDKLKKSIAGKKFHRENPEIKILSGQKRKRLNPPKISECVVCEKKFKGIRKTCSKKCLSINQRNNALKQKKHGGGKKGVYRNFYCDSTYELAFLIYHLDHDIPIKRCEEKRPYIHKDTTYMYNPDFVVNGKIYEIKGYMSEKSKSKLKCNPDVILIDKPKIQKYIKYVKKTYKTSIIYDLYENAEKRPCIICDKYYTPRVDKQKTCSRICNGKRKPSKDTRKKISKASKNYWLGRRDSNAQ